MGNTLLDGSPTAARFGASVLQLNITSSRWDGETGAASDQPGALQSSGSVVRLFASGSDLEQSNIQHGLSASLYFLKPSGYPSDNDSPARVLGHNLDESVSGDWTFSSKLTAASLTASAGAVIHSLRVSDTADIDAELDVQGLASLDGGINVRDVFTVSTAGAAVAATVSAANITASAGAVIQNLRVADGTDLDGALNVDGAATLNDVTFAGSAANARWDKSEDAMEFNDNASAEFGTHLDMKLYHDGTNSYITNAVGALKIATETSGIAVTIGHGTSEVTIGDNLTVTGDLTVTGNTVTNQVEVISTSSGVLFEGGADDGHEGTLKSAVAGADVTYTLPNASGHVGLFAADPGTTTISATPAELNYLDHDDLTAADLIKLAAITATAAEINDLTSNAVDADDFTKLAAVTSTAAELNLLDDSSAGAIVNSRAAIYSSVGALTASTMQAGVIEGLHAEFGGGFGSTGVSISNAGVIQADGAISSGGAVTGTSLTDGTATISSGAASGLTTVAMGGALSGVTTIAGSSLASLGSIAIDNSSTIGCDADGDIITLANTSMVIANDVDFDVAKAGGFKYAGTAVTSTAAELNLLDGSVVGRVVASKAAVYSSSGSLGASMIQGIDLGAGIGLSLDFSTCNTGTGKIMLKDNLAAALEVQQGVGGSAVSYLKFVSTNSSESVDIGVDLNLASGASVTADGFLLNSDETLKKDIKTLDNALGKVMAMRGVTYQFKSRPEKQEVGFLAQEMKNSVPEVVGVTHQGTLAIDYAKLTSVLVEAVKSQQEQIEELRQALLKK
jgi:hypothetical protein